MFDRIIIAVGFFTLCLVAGFVTSTPSRADTLDNIKKSGEIKIGYRKDAPPYSYQGPDGKPAGYTIDLCQAVVGRLKQQLQLGSLNSKFVAVTAKARFEAIRQGKIDLLCGASTITLSRRKVVDFSVPFFADGATVVFRSGGPSSLPELAGHKVGVVSGTTTEKLLKRTLEVIKIKAEVVSVSNHLEAIKQMKSGKLAAYFADRGVLQHLVSKLADRADLQLSDRFFSFEPYGLGLRHGDNDFRLAIDTALSKIFRSPDFSVILLRHFKGNPSSALKTLFLISALPN